MVNLNHFKQDKKEKSLTQSITKHWKKGGAAVAMILFSGVLAACGDPTGNRADTSPEQQTPMTSRTEEPGTVGQQPGTTPGTPGQQPGAVGQQPGMTPGGDGMGVISVGDFTDNKEEMIGQTVTVSGEIDEIKGLNSFVLQDEDSLLDGSQVLVISAPDQTEPNIREGERVQVTGEVRQFMAEEFEREFNLTWDENTRQDIANEYEGRAVIVSNQMMNIQ